MRKWQHEIALPRVMSFVLIIGGVGEVVGNVVKSMISEIMTNLIKGCCNGDLLEEAGHVVY